MNDDPLVAILRAADERLAPPPPSSDLASAVRSKARSMRAVRTGSTVLAVALLALVALPFIHSGPPRGVQSPRPVTADVPLAALQQEADLRLAVSKALVARERDRELRRSKGGRYFSPADVVQHESDRAALTLIDHGDRLRRELMQPDAAIRAYRRTIELFPDTRWASIARRRIDDLKA